MPVKTDGGMGKDNWQMDSGPEKLIIMPFGMSWKHCLGGIAAILEKCMGD